MKRTIIVGIVFLFLSTTCLPVLASEGKPDLIVDGIGRVPEPDYNLYSIVVNIKNIGNETANGTFSVHYDVKRLLFFGRIVHSVTRELDLHELKPVEVHQHCFGLQSQVFPAFGIFFELNCTVNPEKTIEESNYDNNNLVIRYFNLFGFIFEKEYQ